MLGGFRWILSHQLAGSARPGLLDSLESDLEFLRVQGVARIVSLTESPLPDAVVKAGFELSHFPISDMGIPTPRACASVCASIVVGLAERPVLLHCRGGIGRTGTVAACCLVNLGREPEQALGELRRVNPNYVQTHAQAMFIEHYARWIDRPKPR